MRTLIAAQTAAAIQDINIASDEYVSLAQSGLVGIEVVKLQVDLDGTWTDILPAIELSATGNYIQVAGPGSYRIVKPVTAGAAAVFINE